MNPNLDYQRAHEKLRKKSFKESFKTALQVVRAMFVLFAVLSAFTGFSAFFEVIRYSLPFAVAAAFSGLFLIVVELAEGFAVGNMLENYYEKKAASPTLSAWPCFYRTAAAVFVALLSVVLSVFGAYYGSKNLADVEGTTKNAYTSRLDSISTAHDRLILAIDSTKREYFAQNSWRNKLKNNQATEQFNAYESEAAQLRADKKTAINDARKAEARDLVEGHIKMDGRAWAAAAWILLLSAGKLFKHWFENYYTYRLVMESGGIKQTEPEIYVSESPEPEIYVSESPEPERLAAGFVYAKNTPNTPNTPNTANYTHKCVNCGSQKGMVNKRKDAKYCSPTCKAEHHNHNKN